MATTWSHTFDFTIDSYHTWFYDNYGTLDWVSGQGWVVHRETNPGHWDGALAINVFALWQLTSIQVIQNVNGGANCVSYIFSDWGASTNGGCGTASITQSPTPNQNGFAEFYVGTTSGSGSRIISVILSGNGTDPLLMHTGPADCPFCHAAVGNN